MNNNQKQFKKKVLLSLALLAFFLVLFGFIVIPSALAQEAPVSQTTEALKAGYAPFALIGAAIAFGFGALGAGIAISGVGSAAMGTIGEKPELATQALIFVGLAEGLVVFGFITALMILGKM